MSLLKWLFENHFWATWWLILLLTVIICETGGNVLVAFFTHKKPTQEINHD